MNSYTIGIFQAKPIIERDGWPLLTALKRNDGERFFIHRLKDGRDLIHHITHDMSQKITMPHYRVTMHDAIMTSSSHYILDKMEFDNTINMFKIDATPISIADIDENLLPSKDAFHTWA
mgnify:CR=1 FL=1